jgi:hypothetical protein
MIYIYIARFAHTSVVLSDDTVLIMGGRSSECLKDVWKSSNGGVRWTLVRGSAEWSGKS